MSATSYRDRQVADEFTAAHAQCRVCANTAEREVLSAYGGRCGGCYSDYVTARRPNPPVPDVQERVERLRKLGQTLAQLGKQDGLAWARRLQLREEAGEQLSIFQRDAWRRALRVQQATAAELCDAA